MEKMKKYVEMKERHQKMIDNLDLKFAFSDEQFEKAMQELGLTKDDTDKIVGIGAGGFCLVDPLFGVGQLFNIGTALQLLSAYGAPGVPRVAFFGTGWILLISQLFRVGKLFDGFAGFKGDSAGCAADVARVAFFCTGGFFYPDPFSGVSRSGDGFPFRDDFIAFRAVKVSCIAGFRAGRQKLVLCDGHFMLAAGGERHKNQRGQSE